MTARLVLGVCFALIAGTLHAEEWYEGGTLHRADAAEWKASTYENRLATAGDFAAKVSKPASMSELLSSAVALESCISEAVDDPSIAAQSVTQIAAACVLLLGLAE